MAKAKSTVASSTDEGDPRARFPHAITLAAAGGHVLPALAKELGAAAPTVEACRAKLQDEGAIRARLLEMPAHAAVALEVLADVGGEAEGAHLAAEIARRTGMPLADTQKILAIAGVAPGYVLVLDTAIGREKLHNFALIAEAAPTVARLVRGVTLPRGAPPATEAGRAHRDVRDSIALATLVLHRSLRLTMDSRIHRASLKSFVKGIGVDPERAEQLLDTARYAGVLVDGQPRGIASLSLPELDRVASATPTPTTMDHDLASFVPADRWVSVEAAARAVALADLEPTSPYPYTVGAYLARAYQPGRLVETIPLSPVLELLERGGAGWIRRRSPRDLADETGDGHVTPSFDVILGPSASPSIVAAVGLGAALSRADQMLTFQIGPRSVEAGLAAGMAPGAFVAALERVGRHGLPDNVRAMVLDWIRSARYASAAMVLLLRVSERLEASVVQALGRHCLGRIGPGQLVVGPRSQATAIEAELSALGVPLTMPSEWLEGDLAAEDGWRTREPFTLRLPPWPDADPALAARYDAAKARGFKDDLALLTPRAAPPATRAPAPRPSPAAPPAAPRAAAPRDPEPLDDEEERVLAQASTLAAPLFEACRGELTELIARFDAAERAEASRALDFPLLWAPLLALLPVYRARALKRATSMAELLDAAWRLCGGSRRSMRGVELMNAVARAALDREFFYEGIDALAGSIGRDTTTTDTALFLFAPRRLPESAPAPVKSSAPGATAGAPSRTATQPEAVRKWMVRAHQRGSVVTVKVGDRESTVRVTGVRTQGNETLFLVVDTVTDEGRALRLDTIASVTFTGSPADPAPAGS